MHCLKPTPGVWESAKRRSNLRECACLVAVRTVVCCNALIHGDITRTTGYVPNRCNGPLGLHDGDVRFDDDDDGDGVKKEAKRVRGRGRESNSFVLYDMSCGFVSRLCKGVRLITRGHIIGGGEPVSYYL